MKHNNRHACLFSLILLLIITPFILSCGSSGGSSGGDSERNNEPETSVVDTLFNDNTLHDKLGNAGDGMSGRRALLAEMPEVQELIEGGDAIAREIIEKFESEISPDKDEHLFLLAYVLEKQNYTAAVSTLEDFLERSLNNGLYAAKSGAAHALRILTGQDIKNSTYYMTTDILETVENAINKQASGTRNSEPVSALSTEPDSSVLQRAGDDIRDCTREFVFPTTDGTDFLRYPADHFDATKRGTIIKVDGQLFNPTKKTITPEMVENMRRRVVDEGGGTYVTDPFIDEQSGQLYQGSYSATFDCSGFAFREFNDGYHWWNDPGEWFEALTAAGALVELPQSEAGPGDFIFWWGHRDIIDQLGDYFKGVRLLPKHVGVVDNVESGTFSKEITAINADFNSGLFRAPLDAAWYEEKYNTPRFFRWAQGGPPEFVENPALPLDKRCSGCDTNNDGYPDTDECPADCPNPVGCVPEPEPVTFPATFKGSGWYEESVSFDFGDQESAICRGSTQWTVILQADGRLTAQWDITETTVTTPSLGRADCFSYSTPVTVIREGNHVDGSFEWTERTIGPNGSVTGKYDSATFRTDPLIWSNSFDRTLTGGTESRTSSMSFSLTRSN